MAPNPSGLECLEYFPAVDRVGKHDLVSEKIVPMILHPFCGHGATGQKMLGRVIEGSPVSPFPTGQANDSVAIDHGDAFSSLTVVLGGREVEKAVVP